MKRSKTLYRSVVALLFILLTAILAIRNYFCDIITVNGLSMEPTLHNGQVVLIDKYFYKNEGLRRDDIAVFYCPMGLSRDTIYKYRQNVLIKRCVGLPVEYVRIQSDSLVVPEKGLSVVIDTNCISYYSRVINYETGQHINGTDNVFFIGDQPLLQYIFQSDWYYFEGDNKECSVDGRKFGFVPSAYIVGKVYYTLKSVENGLAKN